MGKDDAHEFCRHPHRNSMTYNCQYSASTACSDGPGGDCPDSGRTPAVVNGARLRSAPGGRPGQRRSRRHVRIARWGIRSDTPNSVPTGTAGNRVRAKSRRGEQLHAARTVHQPSWFVPAAPPTPGSADPQVESPWTVRSSQVPSTPLATTVLMQWDAGASGTSPGIERGRDRPNGLDAMVGRRQGDQSASPA